MTCKFEVQVILSCGGDTLTWNHTGGGGMLSLDGSSLTQKHTQVGGGILPLDGDTLTWNHTGGGGMLSLDGSSLTQKHTQVGGGIFSGDRGSLTWKPAELGGGGILSLDGGSLSLVHLACPKRQENHEVLTFCWLMCMLRVLKHWFWVGANVMNCATMVSLPTLARGLQPQLTDSWIKCLVISCLTCDNASNLMISMIATKKNGISPTGWDSPGEYLGTLVDLNWKAAAQTFRGIVCVCVCVGKPHGSTAAHMGIVGMVTSVETAPT